MDYDAFADWAAARFGCRCTTVLVYHEAAAERLYSSDPDIVPARGRKRFDDAPAMARMRARGETQVFRGEEELRAMFGGIDRLTAIGCLCLVNLPVRDGAGQLIGQVNLNLPNRALSSGELRDLAARAQALSPRLEAAREV
ncbi:hypothetical protein RM543_10460 [Roseicyclus sp. F158]|uniref:GAF domain-containing protein n=1 Tax=Tropicimonas omnivorans TaxID=3075590 RepID=A0ABU3DHC5_9RHOB|nr:hypothetical protein [Roseicyclus sp. F158]MDT0683109.1 hypothetical protein [Roseicyclus sp. F158]